VAGCHALFPLTQQGEERDGSPPDRHAELHTDGHADLSTADVLPSDPDGADDLSDDLLADLLSRDYPPCGSCDDGIACTDDSCQYGACVNTPKPGYCMIGTACILDKTPNPQNPLCEVCKATTAPTVWSSNDGIRCDDKIVCSYWDECSSKACKGTSYSCAADAAALTCIENVCTGGGPPPWGCVLKPGSCLIGGACVVAGKANATNACELCQPAVSAYSWAPAKSCVTTLAGDGVDNPTAHFGVKAQLSQPYGVAVAEYPGGSKVVYVAEHDGCVIRRITAGDAVIAAGCG
jgi:hypothetical protein